MNDSERSLFAKIVRVLAIIVLGLFVFTGLVLGACFLVFS